MNMIRLSALLATVLATIAPFPVIAQTQIFQCAQGGGFEAQIGDRKAKIQFTSGERRTLLPVDSRVGKKFSDGRILLYVNGTEAWVQVNYTSMYTECVAQQGASTLSNTR
jgi:membrane-bound inhibitor of C-type lysozyme